MIEDKISSIAGRQPNILGHEEFFKSAVLLPLVNYEGELCVIFEKRASGLDVQPGEICFPGGGIEYDEDERNAAVRECCEELGLIPEEIEVIGALDIFVSPFNLIVYPFLARIKEYRNIQINRDEVEYVFYVPLKYLLQLEPPQSKIGLKLELPEEYPYDLIPNGREYSYREGKYPLYFYLWKHEVIWGLTARILNHFLNILKQ